MPPPSHAGDPARQRAPGALAGHAPRGRARPKRAAGAAAGRDRGAAAPPTTQRPPGRAAAGGRLAGLFSAACMLRQAERERGRGGSCRARPSFRRAVWTCGRRAGGGGGGRREGAALAAAGEIRPADRGAAGRTGRRSRRWTAMPPKSTSKAGIDTRSAPAPPRAPVRGERGVNKHSVTRRYMPCRRAAGAGICSPGGLGPRDRPCDALVYGARLLALRVAHVAALFVPGGLAQGSDEQLTLQVTGGRDRAASNNFS